MKRREERYTTLEKEQRSPLTSQSPSSGSWHEIWVQTEKPQLIQAICQGVVLLIVTINLSAPCSCKVVLHKLLELYEISSWESSLSQEEFSLWLISVPQSFPSPNSWANSKVCLFRITSWSPARLQDHYIVP